MNVKDSVRNYFKLHGFILEPKATVYVTSIFSNLDSDKCTKIMDKIISAIMEQQLFNNKVTMEVIEKAVSICRKDSSSLKLFQVIDSFKIPKLEFDVESKKFGVTTQTNLSRFAKILSDDANDKSDILRNRYQIILERLKRNKILNFQNTFKPIEYLLTCGVLLKNVVVLAMLTQFQEGQWFLEDPSGTIPINLERTKYHKGLVLDGSFVLSQGQFEDGTFYAETIGMPPIEIASASRNAIQNNCNYFGGLPSNGSVKTCSQLEKISHTEMSGKSLVFISEIWLDKETISQKLKILFNGYARSKPGAFIFCGDFLSPDTLSLSPSEKLNTIKQAINNVIKIFASFPELALNSHLVFVPGPNDPVQGPRNILPRPSLPASFILDGVFDSLPGLTTADCDDLKERIILTSNPCRMTFYNKEIVVFRESIAQKLYRHCMYIPSEEDQPDETQTMDDSMQDFLNNTITEHNDEMNTESQETKQTFFLESQLVWTILSQGHLMPLPIHVSPVFWGFDQALQLFPIPDLIVLSDPAATSFDIQTNGCITLNPPNFSSGENFPFKIYYPFKGEIQSCNLDI